MSFFVKIAKLVSVTSMCGFSRSNYIRKLLLPTFTKKKMRLDFSDNDFLQIPTGLPGFLPLSVRAS